MIELTAFLKSDTEVDAWAGKVRVIEKCDGLGSSGYEKHRRCSHGCEGLHIEVIIGMDLGRVEKKYVVVGAMIPMFEGLPPSFCS